MATAGSCFNDGSADATFSIGGSSATQSQSLSASTSNQVSTSVVSTPIVSPGQPSLPVDLTSIAAAGAGAVAGAAGAAGVAVTSLQKTKKDEEDQQEPKTRSTVFRIRGGQNAGLTVLPVSVQMFRVEIQPWDDGTQMWGKGRVLSFKGGGVSVGLDVGGQLTGSD